MIGTAFAEQAIMWLGWYAIAGSIAGIAWLALAFAVQARRSARLADLERGKAQHWRERDAERAGALEVLLAEVEVIQYMAREQESGRAEHMARLKLVCAGLGHLHPDHQALVDLWTDCAVQQGRTSLVLMRAEAVADAIAEMGER